MVLAISAVAGLTGCVGGSGSTGSGGTSPTAKASPTPTEQSNKPRLEGQPRLFSQSYPLPDTTGHSTYVAFRVTNPSSFPMVSPFRVTLHAGAKSVSSDGTNTVVLAPHETRWVSFSPIEDIEGATAPQRADVSFYANQAGQMVLPKPTDWRLTKPTLSCDTLSTVCEANADVTFSGPEREATGLSVEHASIIIHRGNSQNGPIIGAGSLTPSNMDGSVTAGEPLPLTGQAIVPDMQSKQYSGPVHVEYSVQADVFSY